jgi:hypothetical protein
LLLESKEDPENEKCSENPKILSFEPGGSKGKNPKVLLRVKYSLESEPGHGLL